MRTLLITAVFPPATGGSGRWLWELYRRLPKSDVLVAAGQHPAQAEFDAAHDLNIVRLPLAMSTWGMLSARGLSGYAGNYQRVRQLIKRSRIERIDCGTLLPEGWLAWLIRRTTGVPYRCYVHGEELNVGAGSRELGSMMRWVLRGSQRIIANSRNTSQLLQEHWDVPQQKISVLHPGVDVQRFIPAPRCSDLRQRLGWSDRPVVLTVGRLQKRKGHDRMIQALPAIRDKIPAALYAIVGDGEERTHLERLVSDLKLDGQVLFHGELGDERLIECYQQCDLCALPNREVDGDIEGFGMVLLEAQACGKPVLAGASGGTAETMRVPETGRIVPCEQPEPLAQAVTELLTDAGQRQQMGQAARRWVVEQFSWESLAQQAQRLDEP